MSVCSRASSKMLEDIANRSQSKIYRLEGTFTDEEMRIIWNALGLYVSRNLRMGRGVNIPKLGIFGFTAAQVSLKGVTNERQRDTQPRLPVFLLQKDFVKGLPLRTAIYFQQQFGAGLRPYAAQATTGEVPITKMNLVEVSSYANMSKDATELGLMRIIKYLGQQLLQRHSLNIEIPNIGQLLSRGNLVAVRFNEYLRKDTRTILSQSLDQRKEKGQMSLTTDNLNKFAKYSQMSQSLAMKDKGFFEIDDKARQYLSNTFNLLLDDESQMQRSTTGFDRSVMTASVRMTNAPHSGGSGWRREYNMALRILKQWILQQGYSSEEAYDYFATAPLHENTLWQGLQTIASDITEQQAHELFRILDNDKDGVISLKDWQHLIKTDNKDLLKVLLKFIANMSVPQVIQALHLNHIGKISLFTLKQAIHRLKTPLTEEQALILAKQITKGLKEVEVETVTQILNLSGKNSEVDEEWVDKFIARLSKKMAENRISKQELQGKLSIYGESIEQTDLKNIFGEIGITLTLSEIIKIVKIFPRDGMRVKYRAILDRINEARVEDVPQLTWNQFIKVVDLRQIKVPVSVLQLTSELQSRVFKQYPQKEVSVFVSLLDVNRDGQITADDIKCIQNNSNVEVNCPVNNGEELLHKLCERCVKKRMSVGDLFKRIDKSNKGFITHQDWTKCIQDIFPCSNGERESLFQHLDVHKLDMIDYKDFLILFNGGTVTESEKFNWAENALNKIKAWVSRCGFSLEDTFKLVDSDGDTYISQEDLKKFLNSKFKYHQKELTSLRLSKVIKIMDVYKRGKITYLDWLKVIKEQSTPNTLDAQNKPNTALNETSKSFGSKTSNAVWLQSARHQLSLVLSRLYSSLSQAFTDITQGDPKLLLSAFQKWCATHKALSGFMGQEDTIKHIFAYLDKHRKGYLLENDFIAQFGGSDWVSEYINEFIDKLKSIFKTGEEAFQCMGEYKHNQIDYIRFKLFVKQMFGDRFKESDIQKLWRSIANGQKILSLNKFTKLYGWKSISQSSVTPVEDEKKQTQVTKLVNIVKDKLRTSPKTLQQAFAEVDTAKTGKITNLTFKKAFRVLNIGITSKQIDLLLNYSDFAKNSLIDWKEFIVSMGMTAEKQQLQKRLHSRLQHLSNLLHYYMVSPKDAFRQWDEAKAGFLSFSQFHFMVKAAYEQAKESVPEYEQVKDLFVYIDARNDEKIDFQEFSQAFRCCSPPSLLMGATPPAQVSIKPAPLPPPLHPIIKEQPIPRFKSSPQYEELLKLIARNRKYLQQQIEKESKEGLVDYGVVEKVIKELAATETDFLRNVIAFAMRGDKVDYILMLDKMKQMSEEVVEFPKKNVIQ